LVLVVGESMQPTLKPGQLLLVDKYAYQNAQPCRGDIVLARYAGELIIKRIVALPGEEVEVQKGTLYIDGVTKRESYPIQEGSLDVAKGKLFDGDFATLGDNRAIPSVLAIHPIISKPDIVGRCSIGNSASLTGRVNVKFLPIIFALVAAIPLPQTRRRSRACLRD
jgi:signal peptidase I